MNITERQIRQAISSGRWMFTDHADERLSERGIEGWQVAEGVDDGEALLIDPDARPNPKVLIRQVLSDGTTIVAVWAYVKSIRRATLITVYFAER